MCEKVLCLFQETEVTLKDYEPLSADIKAHLLERSSNEDVAARLGTKKAVKWGPRDFSLF